MENVICIGNDIVIRAEVVIGAMAVRSTDNLWSVNLMLKMRKTPFLVIPCKNEEEAKKIVADIGSALA